MKCPVDGTTLVIAERQGVEIDYCPQCRGVWLDRGELDKIIERATAEILANHQEQMQQQQRQQPTYQERDHRRDDRDYRDRDRGRDRDYRDDKYYKRKRRGSFLEELFDFD